MQDIILVTAESLRRDFVDEMEFVSSHDLFTGVTTAHYTRPSLASLLSSSYRAAIRTQIERPTIAEVLREYGYTCIGLTTSPQADGNFGFDAGFETYENHVDPHARGTIVEDIVHSVDLVGRLFYRLFPRQKRRASTPRDDEIVEQAIDTFNRSDPPRFLWVHLMESHFPYGRRQDAISPKLTRKALFSPDKLTDRDDERIRSAYRKSLARVDGWIETLFEELETEPVYGFAGDHGELFGEHGLYFHPPEHRLVDEALTTVPVLLDGIDVRETNQPVSLLDIGPTLLGEVGIEIPTAWDGCDLGTQNRQYTITIAPWKDRATVAYRTDEFKLTARDANVAFESQGTTTTAERPEIPDELQEELRHLGYIETE